MQRICCWAHPWWRWLKPPEILCISCLHLKTLFSAHRLRISKSFYVSESTTTKLLTSSDNEKTISISQRKTSCSSWFNQADCHFIVQKKQLLNASHTIWYRYIGQVFTVEAVKCWINANFMLMIKRQPMFTFKCNAAFTLKTTYPALINCWVWVIWQHQSFQVFEKLNICKQLLMFWITASAHHQLYFKLSKHGKAHKFSWELA